jgi:site-specific recombinase XerD
MLLLDTGLRCAELTSCKLGDVHIDRGYLKVMGKGARERMVPIGVTVRKALVEYLRASRPGPASSQIDNLFLSEDGKPLLVGGVQLMLKRLGRRCGVPRLHTHLCRHTFATNYLINGGDLFTLQHILGHSSLEMVRRYVTLASGFVAMQHQRFSPLDKMYQGASRFGRGARFAEHLQQNQRFGTPTPPSSSLSGGDLPFRRGSVSVTASALTKPVPH